MKPRLHTRLLNRTTRSVSLTEAGRLYLQRARRIVDDIQHLDPSITTRNSEPSGIVRIAASISLDSEGAGKRYSHLPSAISEGTPSHFVYR